MQSTNAMAKKSLHMSIDPSSGVEELVAQALDQRQDHMKSLIAVGVKEVSPSKSDIKKQAKKIQIKMVAQETRRALDYARIKDANSMTGDDYMIRKAVVDQKLQKLIEKAENGDTEDLDEYVAELEDDTLAEKIYAQVGKKRAPHSKDEKESIEMAKNMIKKLTEERKERKQALRQRKREKEQRRQKMKEEKEKKLKMQEEKERGEFENKKTNILNKIQSRRDKIKNLKEEVKKETKKVVQRSPLHKKITQNFHQKHVIPELQKRKEILSQIRNFHKPIRLENIKEHSENKKVLFKEKLKEYFHKRSDYAQAANDNKDRYNSKFWKVVNDREKAERNMALKNKSEIHERHQKSLDYAKNVKELYKPEVSKKKKLEMELIRRNLDNPHSISKTRRGLQTVKQSHNESMMSPKSNQLSTEVSSPLRRSYKKFAKPKPLDEKRYSYHPTPYDKFKFVKHDYLKERRQKLEDNNHSRAGRSQERWESDMLKGHYTQDERIEYIKLKASEMEEGMKRKEALLKANNNTTIDDTKEIDGMLIDSIKTKLNLISGIS